MKISTKAMLATFIIGLLAFALGRVIWPDADGMPMPSTAQLGFFAFLALVQGLLFGFGIAFAILFGPRLKKVSAQYKNYAKAAFVSLVWLMVSWWPHDNLHRHNGMNIQGLLYVDYGFHLTVILATVVLIAGFVKIVQDSTSYPKKSG